MKQWTGQFHNWTLKTKLTVILMTTGVISTGFVCAVFIVLSVFFLRKEHVRDLQNLSTVIGQNSQAALKFDIPEDASNILKSLAADESVIFACMYRANGDLFATYRQHDLTYSIIPPTPQVPGYRFEGDFLKVFCDIRFEGELIGRMYFQDDRREEHIQFEQKTTIMMIVMLGAIVATYIVSQRLQKVISGPILALAATAANVAAKQDYSIRAKKQTADEVGTLIDSFNDMLEQIERGEEVLRQSEERYRTLVDNIGLGITLIDADYNVVMMNSAVSRLFKIPAEQLLGKKCYNLFMGHDDACEHCPGFKSFDTHVAEEVEMEGLRADGTTFPMRIRAFPMHDRDDHISGFIEVTEDITERKQAERILRETQERLADFFQNAPIGFHIFGPDQKIMDINDAELAMIGYKRSEIVGVKAWDDLIVPEQTNRFKLHWADIITKGTAKDLEYTLVHKDGHLVDVILNASGRFDEQGNLINTRGSVLDISERNRITIELRESRQMLKTVLDTINVRVYWKDRDSVYLGCNRLFAEDAGLKEPEDIIGKTDLDLAWKDLAPSYRDSDHEVIESGKSILNIEEPTKKPNGTSLWASTSKIPLRDQDENIIGVLGTYQDITQRKRANLALRLSEQRFRAIADYTYNWELWISPTGNVLWTNPAVERVTGYTVEECMTIKNYPGTLVIEEDREMAEQARREGLEQGTGQIECRIRRKDGRMIWVTSSWQPIYDDKGVWQGQRVSVRDVTDRKLAEIALEASRERFRSLVETTSDWIWEVDREGVYSYVSPKVKDLLGYHPQEIIGKTPFDLMPPDEAEPISRIFKETTALTKPLKALENMNLHKDGRIVILETNAVPIFDQYGNFTGYRGIDRDITERKLLDEAMDSVVEGTVRATGEDFLRSLVRHLAAAIKCKHVLLGRLVEPQLDKIRTLAVWADGDYGDNFEYALENTPCKHALEQETPYYTEHVRKLFPHDPLLAQTKAESYLAVPLIDSSGNTLGCIAAVHDKPIDRLELAKTVMSIFATRAATELDRAHVEEERERLLWVLEAKNRELESIVYTSSHDLRSTIVNVRGFSSELATTCDELLELLADIPVPDDTRHTLETIVKDEIPTEIKYITASATKMDMLIAGLLKLSRLGRIQTKPENIDMNVLAGEVINSMRYQIRETATTVSVSQLPPCRADISQVNQILWNLIDNAVKYRDTQRPCVIEISGYTEDNMSVYCVADNGKGISPKHQKNIFEVFHRLEPEGPVPGEGLGLSIITRIVDRHGGKVWVESDIGCGSRFFISLPTA